MTTAKFPSLNLLTTKSVSADPGDVQAIAQKLLKELQKDHKNASIVAAYIGPRVTEYHSENPDRIIIVKNKKPALIPLKKCLDDPGYSDLDLPLSFPLGVDQQGRTITCDLKRAPHLLLSGRSGSGKSQTLYALLASLLFKNTPDELNLILIDPKQVEFSEFNNLPHLLTPIITDTRNATSALNWAAHELDRRYSLLEKAAVKNFDQYNAKTKKKLPQIVIVADEIAELMLQDHQTEPLLIRLAQAGRAAGIHLVLSTQTQNPKILTGRLKANFATRLAYKMDEKKQSLSFLSQPGAELLLGQGDFLYTGPESAYQTIRLQAPYVTCDELANIADFWREQKTPSFNPDLKKYLPAQKAELFSPDDPIVRQAVQLIIDHGVFSTSFLQTRLRKGYGFVSKLGFWLEDLKVIAPITPETSNKPRPVLISSMKDFDALIDTESA